MKETTRILDELISELYMLQKKTEKIFQDAEKLRKKIKPDELKSLVGRSEKLTGDFGSKIKAIKKMALKERR